MKYLSTYDSYIKEGIEWKKFFNLFRRTKKWTPPPPKFDLVDLRDICLELEDIGFNTDVLLRKTKTLKSGRVNHNDQIEIFGNIPPQTKTREPVVIRK
jgi:hypothetical protein